MCKCGHSSYSHWNHSGACWFGFGTAKKCKCQYFKPTALALRK